MKKHLGPLLVVSLLCFIAGKAIMHSGHPALGFVPTVLGILGISCCIVIS